MAFDEEFLAKLEVLTQQLEAKLEAFQETEANFFNLDSVKSMQFMPSSLLYVNRDESNPVAFIAVSKDDGWWIVGPDVIRKLMDKYQVPKEVIIEDLVSSEKVSLGAVYPSRLVIVMRHSSNDHLKLLNAARMTIAFIDANNDYLKADSESKDLIRSAITLSNNIKNLKYGETGDSQGGLDSLGEESLRFTGHGDN